jgi:hypothetical protein
MRWAGHIPRMEEMRNAYKHFVGKAAKKNRLGDLSVDGSTIFKRALKKRDLRCGLDATC